MPGQEIAIHSQNIVEYLKFLMRPLDFWYNQTYELSYIYNKYEDWVYNEMYTGKWWWKQLKRYPLQATIILFLISSNKTIVSLGYEDQTLWSVYILIRNLDAKIRRSQKQLGMLLLDSIPIIHEWSEDAKNRDKDLKAKIYYMTLKTML